MVQQFLERCLLLDLETSRDGRILEIGAVHGERCFAWRGDPPLPRALIELDRFAAGADFVLGHNLLGHDLPILDDWCGRLGARLTLLARPVIDTLVLSPLAFPENPYHRLVKDYKLVGDSASDPLADARLAARLFADEWRTFAALPVAAAIGGSGGDIQKLAFYAFCFAGGGSGTGGERQADDRGGMAAVFSAISGRAPLTAAGARAYLAASLSGLVCREGLEAATAADALPAPAAAGAPPAGEDRLARPRERLAWAFAVAWLHVAGGGSVLPRWVRARYPRTVELLDALRGRPCGDPGCAYCRESRDLEAQLRRFFGLSAFRPAPAAADGGSLQRALVEQGLAGRPLLAVLPTGGGKSLCYQLPALIRHHRRGLLTIVVSPLQALMQDQVEQLNRRAGFDRAAALNGMLTPPERGATLERVKLGEVAILYVSPEQLRNRSFVETIEQREIGAWVFDEAHCLSKWGHDFRPDYLYASRFIRELAELQQRPVPPVACFTATAKPDVQREILEHFREELGAELVVLGAGARRPELTFAVEAVGPAAKLPRIRGLLAEHLRASPRGAALVYFTTRHGADEGARHLVAHGVRAEAFHAGLPPPEKRRILDLFVRGELPVVCATNAFGMGIDKEDVRLVVHADIPGSLESYLQEAGRAGRDRRPASCILLFDSPDVERQFRLAALSRVDRRDIAQILRGLRALARRQGGGQEVVATTRELLASEEVETRFDAGDRGADTQVKTAVAWLERAGFLERNQNHTRVFQGRPRVTSLAAAGRRIDEIVPPLAPVRRAVWLAILLALFACDPDQGVTADELAELPAFAAAPAGEDGDGGAGGRDGGGPAEPAGMAAPGERPGEGGAGERTGRAGEAEPDGEERPAEPAGARVLRELYDMARHGLIESGLQLTAYVKAQSGRGSAPATLRALCRLEREMIKALRDRAPEAEDGGWRELSMRQLNQSLMDRRGLPSHPEALRRLLQGLGRRDRTAPRTQGGLELAYRSRYQYLMRLRGSWEDLGALAERRQAVAWVVLDALLARVPAAVAALERQRQAGAEAVPEGQPDPAAAPEPAAAAAPDPRPGSKPAPAPVLVPFGLEDLVQELRRDLRLGPQIADPLAAVERALLFLHELKVIQLQRGLAVFRQAMTLRLMPRRGRANHYTDKDFAPLAAHYAERASQIHVMARYAELAKDDGERALALVDDYFTLDRESFVRRHFPGDEAAMLFRATGRESFRAVVDSLANRAQIELVTAPAAASLLILAGPGAGKTRVVVHRCACLLRVERVPARGILVVCFNRAAAREVWRRLRQLVGQDAREVVVQTYHGLALLLTGTSLVEAARRGEEPDFDRLIDDANRLLSGRAGLSEGGAGGAGGASGGGERPPGAEALEGSHDEDERAAATGLDETLRERLLAGFSHILVDEYQDINHAQYELLSHLAGRGQHEPDRRRSILAVGDDDQTIYGFNGARVGFIRRFHQDYDAEVHYLVENFRSSAAIIACANRLIEHNRARLKREHPIRIDTARAAEPPGGRWAALDAAGGGRVQVVRAAGAGEQAAAVVAWVRELRRLDPALAWQGCAVLARTRRELEPIRALCEHQGIPVRWPDEHDQMPPLHRVREIAGFLAALAERRASECSAAELSARCSAGGPPGHPWWSLLRELLLEWRDAHGDAEATAGQTLGFLYDALAERRRETARGEGVHLSTVHGAKGLEFAHVLLAGGGWGARAAAAPQGQETAASPDAPDVEQAQQEEERRLFYVGMTRARETLTLLWRRDQRHPFLREIREGSERLDLVEREPLLEAPPAAILARRFALLGLGCLFLDHAGRRPPGDPVHARLDRLQPGSALAVRGNPGGGVELLDEEGLPVAALSQHGRTELAAAIAGAEEVRVVAVVERRASDAQPDFQPFLRCERWFVPVAEIRYRDPAAPAADAVR